MKTGFAAMGLSVPYNRREAAYKAAKDMGVQDAFSVVDAMAEQLRRDKPFEALQISEKYVDLCGGYRLIAHLLTEPK